MYQSWNVKKQKHTVFFRKKMHKSENKICSFLYLNYRSFYIQIIVNSKQKMILSIPKKLTSLLLSLSLICIINSAIIETGEDTCCGDDIITVNGLGRVAVQPDIAFINIAASSNAKTSQEATKRVADQINQILSVLKKNNIRPQDIRTESISVNPVYDYSTGVPKLVNNSAQQSLAITIRKIDNNGGGLGMLIDQLVVINGIQFNGLRFEKEVKTDALILARKMAFEDAKKKAQDLALLSQRSLGKVVSVNDLSLTAPSPVVQNFARGASLGSAVPVGSQEVSYNLSVRFALK